MSIHYASAHSDALTGALRDLAPDARRRWAICVAVRAVEALPADSLRRRVLLDALRVAYPPDRPAASPDVREAQRRALDRLLRTDTVGQEYYATAAVYWGLGNPCLLLVAGEIGAAAVGAASYRASASWYTAAARDARANEHAWQLLRAALYAVPLPPPLSGPTGVC